MGVRISDAKMLHKVSSNPQPIVVEKLTGKHVPHNKWLQGGNTCVVQQEQLGACGGSIRNALSSTDMMNQALILAQLDLKKKKRCPEIPLPIFNREENKEIEKVAKPTKTKLKPKVKVHEVSNRPLRNASVQFSSISNQRNSPEPTPLSQLPRTTNSPPTHDKESNNQQMQHLQKEICKQLTDMKDLLDNLIKECYDPKPVLPVEEEEEECTNISNEQGALRALTRQVYIVQQQIADVERKLNTLHNYKSTTQLHSNKLDWTKSRLVAAYRSAYKSLQGMTTHLRRCVDPVIQLRLIDLLSQLLQSVRKLFDLYLQLSSLFSKNVNSTYPELLDLVDHTDALQSEWQELLECKLKRILSNGSQGSVLSDSSRKKSSSKRCQNIRQPFLLKDAPERKSILQKSSEPSNPSKNVHKTTKKFPTMKKQAKSVIFPHHIQIHRKPNEVFTHQHAYTQSTLSSSSKSEAKGKCDSPELRQSVLTPAENKRNNEQRPDLPGFGGQPLASHSVNKMKQIGESIIEELLALDSERQRERQEAKHIPLVTNDVQEKSDVQKVESIADLHFTDEEARLVDLNLPPLEVLLHRIQEMENEQLQIRSRLPSLKYHDTETAAQECSRAKGSVPSGNHHPSSPSPIFLSKMASSEKSFEIVQEEQSQKCLSGEFPGAIRFTKTKSKTNQQRVQSEEYDEIKNRTIQLDGQQEQGKANITLDSLGRKPKRLFLSNKILKNVTENRQRFTNYLLNSAYHQVETFDPWRLTEELADSILEDCIQEISEEMQDLSHDSVNRLFNNEFAQIPPLPTSQNTTDRSLFFSSIQS